MVLSQVSNYDDVELHFLPAELNVKDSFAVHDGLLVKQGPIRRYA